MKKLLAIFCIAIAIFTLFALPFSAASEEIIAEYEVIDVTFSSVSTSTTGISIENGKIYDYGSSSITITPARTDKLYIVTNSTVTNYTVYSGVHKDVTLEKTFGNLKVYSVSEVYDYSATISFGSAAKTVGFTYTLPPDPPPPPPPPTPLEIILGEVSGFGTAIISVWQKVVTFVTTDVNNVVLIGLVAWLFVVGCGGILKLVTM